MPPSSRQALVLDAAQRAYRLRSSAGLSLSDPIDVYALANKIGLNVWFAEIGSMEGVYSPTSETIVISSLRPRGRQAFTCAHEIAHHIYEDGDQFDELTEARSDARRHEATEFRADTFAGQLLMPKSAVLQAFQVRGHTPIDSSPEVLYGVACLFGVGYSTLVHHLNKGLGLLGDARAHTLRAVKLPTIRQRIVGRSCSTPLVVVDSLFSVSSIDAELGDWVVLPPTMTTLCAQLQLLDTQPNFTLARASSVGVSSLVDSDLQCSVDVRVSQRNYVGRAEYRFEPSEDDPHNGN